MKILFMGTPEIAAVSLRRLLEEEYDIVGVVTQPDRPSGRGKRMQYSPIKQIALRHDLRVFQPCRVRDPEVQEQLAALKPDLAVTVAFGQILPQTLLDMPVHGCLNVHPSLLPAYRGAAPIQWAVLNGEKETGVTIMKMDAGLDTGDILTQEKIAIAPDETGGSLQEKLAVLGADLLARTIPDYVSGRIIPRRQGETTTIYAKRLEKEMGRIDWRRPAVEIERLIRGMSPWPSAFTVANGRNFKIWSARVEEEPEEEARKAAPGEIVMHTADSLAIQTGDGLLFPTEVQMEGKKRMAIADFLRGTATLTIDKGD